MNNFEFALKAFLAPEHAENFSKGNILIRSLEYYRCHKYPRGDKYEAIFPDKSLSGLMFILCMHNPPLDKSDYGNNVLQIYSPQKLFDNIRDKLKPYIIPAATQIKPVTYYNPEEKISSLDFIDIPFFKRNLHAKDKEIRMLFYFKDCDRNLEDTEDVRFNFYTISGKDRISNALSKTEWLDSRNKSHSYGDDHYIEMTISNVKFDSHLLPV